LLPDGCGYFRCKQNMKLVTTKFKSGGPHEKHVVATWLQPATRILPQPSHTEIPKHIETRTHDQCGDTIEKSQAPDDGCINIRNLLSIEVK